MEDKTESTNSEETFNKGTGAGGAKTNHNGKKFEEKTNNQTRLLTCEYAKVNLVKKPKNNFDYYLSKKFDDRVIIFALQNAFNKYMKLEHKTDLIRYPDEAYMIIPNSGKKIIKILEKKNQNVEGSVETKLWSGPSLKREYELLLGDEYEIHYAFCVSKFLKEKFISEHKKYIILNKILKETGIDVLFGDDEDYFEKLDAWINNS